MGAGVSGNRSHIKLKAQATLQLLSAKVKRATSVTAPAKHAPCQKERDPYQFDRECFPLLRSTFHNCKMPSEVIYRAPSGPLAAPDGGARHKHLTFTQVKKKTTVFQRAAVFTHIFIIYVSGFLIYPGLIYLAWSRWPILWFLMFE